MSTISQYSDVSNLKDLTSLLTFLSRALGDIASTVNGKLDFPSNFACQIVSVQFTAANTDVVVSHDLKRVPAGYIPIKSSVASPILAGRADWTSSKLFLTSASTGSAEILLI